MPETGSGGKPPQGNGEDDEDLILAGLVVAQDVGAVLEAVGQHSWLSPATWIAMAGLARQVYKLIKRPRNRS